ncbi:MAG: PPOX class F420-dependent oxidoreductase [Acidimicrobiales bacterium]
MAEMTLAERRAFLDEGARTAIVAVVRSDGRPHAAPVWFVTDPADDALMFTTAASSVKGRALCRDPRVALCVDDETPPFAFVLVEGAATVSADLDEMLRWATAIGGRYMGAGRAEEFGRRNAVPGELLVRVTPTLVVARKYVAD